MSDTITIDCQGCGSRMSLPPEIPEAGEFICARCGLVMRNVPAARDWRWEDQDPFVRRWGASRLNLWGGAIGSVIWLPIVLIVLGVQGLLAWGTALAITLPYLALVAAVMLLRGRTPAALWTVYLFLGLGFYVLLLSLLVPLDPGIRALLESEPGGQWSIGGLRVMGALWVLCGGIGVIAYRRKVARLPQVDGVPPADRE